MEDNYGKGRLNAIDEVIDFLKKEILFAQIKLEDDRYIKLLKTGVVRAHKKSIRYLKVKRKNTILNPKF